MCQSGLIIHVAEFETVNIANVEPRCRAQEVRRALSGIDLCRMAKRVNVVVSAQYHSTIAIAVVAAVTEGKKIGGVHP